MMLLNSFRKVTQLRDRGPGHLVTLARPPDSLTRVRSGLEAGGSEDGLGFLEPRHQGIMTRGLDNRP